MSKSEKQTLWGDWGAGKAEESKMGGRDGKGTGTSRSVKTL